MSQIEGVSGRYTCSAWLTETIHTQLDEVSEDLDMHKSEIIRQGLLLFFEEFTNTPPEEIR